MQPPSPPAICEKITVKEQKHTFPKLNKREVIGTTKFSADLPVNYIARHTWVFTDFL